MIDSLDVMAHRNNMQEEQVDGSINKIEEKLDPSLIKSRKLAGKQLDYIEGHTVIDILNKAFKYNWSFEIVEKELTYTKNKKGEDVAVVHILGRLVVPGFGVKEQYGAKQMVGGPDVQEGAFKAATTDALKKCATLFGVGKELYEEDEKAESSSNQNTGNQSKSKSSGSKLNEKYANRIKELKGHLNIKSNEELNPYVRTATDGQAKSYKEIDNTNAHQLIKILEEEAKQGVS